MSRGKSRSLESIAAANAEDLVQEYADKINTALGRTVEAILDTGQALLSARASLPHGRWEELFPKKVPMSVSTAKRLMLIAEHKVLSNRAHVHALPPAWGHLYELSKLPEITLTRAIAAGAINPMMQRRDVAVLRETPEEKPRRPGAEAGALPDQDVRLRAALTLLAEALEEVDKAVEAKTIDPALAIRAYTGIVEMATEAAGLAVKIQVHAQRQVGLLLADPETQILELDAQPAESPAEPEPYRCTSCDRDLAEDELAEVRECSREDCGERFDAAAEGARNCTACNRPFTRLVTRQGCPDCLGEDGEVVEAELTATAPAG